jgi:hypothetical protein
MRHNLSFQHGSAVVEGYGVGLTVAIVVTTAREVITGGKEQDKNQQGCPRKMRKNSIF